MSHDSVNRVLRESAGLRFCVKPGEFAYDEKGNWVHAARRRSVRSVSMVPGANLRMAMSAGNNEGLRRTSKHSNANW
jgi:hypothetical protein